MRCLHCGADTTNGLALCELCRGYIAKALEFMPIYFCNLARWRPGRAGSRPVPGSRVLYDGSTENKTDRIADALDEAHNALTTWADALVDARPHFPRPMTLTDAVLAKDLSDVTADQLNVDPARTVALLCAGLTEHLTSIATIDWCGELVRELGQHQDALQALTETAVPGWYAGACRYCGAPTYVVPGLTWTSCRACGATSAARDHLEVVLTEARGWVARPMRIAEAIVALLDTEESVPRLHKRISKWGERGRIPAIRRIDADGDEVGPKRYRLGDVLSALASEELPTMTDERIGA